MIKPGILCVGLCSFIFSVAAFSAQTDSSQSLQNGQPPSMSAMQNCPVQTVAGVTLRSYDQNIPLTNTKSCTSWMGAGSVGWGWWTVLIIINVFGAGGSFEPRCDSNSNYPYLGGFSETTGGFFALLAGGGGGDMSYYCCSMSQTGEVSLKMGYNPNSPSTYNTWATSCQ